MQDSRIDFSTLLAQASAADITTLRSFLLSDPSRPLIATGSGGAESVADFAALLYGARGGMAAAVTPYTLNAYSDDALRASKLLLVSKGGHNNDILFAAKRGLAVNPLETASFTLSTGDRNEVRKAFLKAGSALSIDIPGIKAHEGFVSIGTPLAYFALLCRTFDSDCDLSKYSRLPEKPFRLEWNDGTALTPEDLRDVRHYVVLHGSWGRPVAKNLEGKLMESGLCLTSVCDYRNYCHGRFIFTSNHLEDSAIVLLVSPRERDIAERTRKFLPASTRLVIIETETDAPEASLDLLLRSTEFFFSLCGSTGTDWGPSGTGEKPQ